MPIDERSGNVPGEPRQVPTSSHASGFWSLSRDGRQIVYAANDSKSNLERFPFDTQKVAVTGPAVPITRGSHAVRSCDVSPDGRWIALHASLPQEDLFVVRADGSGSPRRLTNDRHMDRHPFWSPDGRRLLFYSNRRGSYEAWLVHPDGGGLEPVLNKGGKPATFPIWSPNGKRVACIMDQNAVVIDLAQPLDKRVPELLPSASVIGERFIPTSWSADGERLAGNLLRLDGSVLEGIGLFSFRSRTFERLTTRGYDPFWMRDGRRLFYFVGGAVFALDIRTGQVYEVLLPGSNTSFDMVSLSPDQRSLYVVRSIEEGDIWLLRLSEAKRRF